MNDSHVCLVWDEPPHICDLAAGVLEHHLCRIGENAHRPFENGATIHRQVMQSFFEHSVRRRNAAAAAGAAEEVATGSVRAKLVGDQALVFFARGEQDRAGTVAKKAGSSSDRRGLITRLLQSPPITKAHWLLPVATNCAAITRAKTKPAQAACTSKAGHASLSRS